MVFDSDVSMMPSMIVGDCSKKLLFGSSSLFSSIMLERLVSNQLFGGMFSILCVSAILLRICLGQFIVTLCFHFKFSLWLTLGKSTCEALNYEALIL